MKNQENYFDGINETKIYYQTWTPDSPKGLILVIHGYGEHSGRYMNVVDTLVPDGYTVWALDNRGHGKSEGRRCHVNRFTDFLEDVQIFEKIARGAHPKLPVHVLGHSMGSLIANHYVSSREAQNYKSLTLSGTGAAPGPAINAILVLISNILSAIVPRLSLASGLDPNFISYDQKVVEAYVNDPLVENKITTRLGSEMMASLPKMIPAAAKLEIPTMMQIGSEDESFHPDSWDKLFAAIGVEDKVFKKYEGCRHEVYNEIKKEVPLGDLKEWLNKHN
ncbi:MAG: alpha/beta hydrolase [Deltaproteobacteria bacterium]|jgi:acylglycerol lipase|nr:alpha/beta hydrolase [Deltaproteobacteria bacterium]MBT4268806.1 alpha/beta hydrolase [Deltaproteobacteria bacterium]MBT4638322.1 alpha/beta hydrolase [Deltaproteobacteria bacterium]MBT6499664.1 alpha/beta hydrolase [Deltaproteobacteria bacterium]MBT7154707.1 alpha/beta hydrolase [Deltaproteobacteria bacterium]